MRFVQGQVRCCMWEVIFGEAKTGAASGIVPTLRKVREEWGNHFYGLCPELKGWGPLRSKFASAGANLFPCWSPFLYAP